MATTYNFTDGSIANVPVPPETTLHENRIVIRRNIIDLSKQTLSCTDDDIAQVINIPAGTTVLRAYARVLTGEASTTVNLGTGVLATAWGTNIAPTTANVDTIIGGTAAPKYFSAADTIDLVATTAGGATSMAAIKIEVMAEMVKNLDVF